jgi:hypothetical protein
LVSSGYPVELHYQTPLTLRNLQVLSPFSSELSNSTL